MKLEAFLEKANIWYEFLERSEGTSAKQASEDTGIPVENFGKSLIVLDKEKNPALIIVPGHKKLSFAKTKDILGVRKLRMCPHERAHEYSGYEPGATCPVFHKVNMPVIVDAHFSQLEKMYGGGGTKTRTIGLLVKDVVRLNDAIVADVCEGT